MTQPVPKTITALIEQGKAHLSEVEWIMIAEHDRAQNIDNIKLRTMLWLKHGCDMLYGDDGEMQCGKCILDFKNDSVEEIRERFLAISQERMARLAEALK